MRNTLFSFHLAGFSIEEICQQEQGMLVIACSQTKQAPCPTCGTPSVRQHSRYRRHLTDLPWSGTHVSLSLRVARFFCLQPTCPRRTFAEALPDLAPRFARRTRRCTDLLETLGMTAGGEAGARLAQILAIGCSAATILRLLERIPLPSASPPRIIGIDDWAWRKGQRYGTIICDLQTHRPLDVLADRSVASVAAWLQEHPTIELISRDRGGVYAEAASRAAPQAVQVADRWHVLQNLGQALEALLTHQLTLHRQETTRQIQETPTRSHEQIRPLSFVDASKEQARRARYEQVITLSKAGMTVPRIAQTVGISTTTVESWLAAGHFPQRKTRSLDPRPAPSWLPYALKRWQQGRSILAISHELQQQGYQGTYWSVYTLLSPLRTAAQTLPLPGSALLLSAKQARWLFLRRPEALSNEHTQMLAALWKHAPALKEVYEMIQIFTTMVRTRNAEPLSPWMEMVEASPWKELHSFVRGLRQDEAAMVAGLSLPWSQGQIEGQITRLKLLKRAMYGRAAFPLLRRRVLAVA